MLENRKIDFFGRLGKKKINFSIFQHNSLQIRSPARRIDAYTLVLILLYYHDVIQTRLLMVVGRGRGIALFFC